MNYEPMTLANLAVERVLERAVHRNRPAQHTLVLGGSANERRGVLDRIEARLRYGSSGTPPHIGRLREPYGHAIVEAAKLWDEAAGGAGLTEDDNGHANGLGRIQNAAGERLFVAIIDDLDTVLAEWREPGEALNLRWALQNVNDLMVVAGTNGPIGRNGPHEHSILAMTFTAQSLETPKPEP